MSKKPALSFIMPSLLTEYPGSAKDRVHKFIRAVHSFLEQDCDHNLELIIISDGCDITIEICDSLINSIGVPANRNIFRMFSSRKNYFSGDLRNEGIEIASSDLIAYLDTDDVIKPSHARNIISLINGSDWCYWNDCVATSPDVFSNTIMRGTSLGPGTIGTSCIAHKKRLGAKWGNGYGHDWLFVQQLEILSPFYRFIQNSEGYVVCHIPNKIDF